MKHMAPGDARPEWAIKLYAAKDRGPDRLHAMECPRRRARSLHLTGMRQLSRQRWICSTQSDSSVRLGTRELDHFAPSLDFSGHVRTELLRREYQRDGRQFREPSPDLRVC
jgi:hypothetical protein